MNREEAAKAIVLLQAYVSGQTIEYKMHNSSLGWNQTDELQGNFSDRDYRVKPTKPLTGMFVTGMFDEERQFIPGQSFRLNLPCIELTDEVKEALETAGIPYE